MIKHILSFILGTFVMLIGFLWVIPYTLETIDSNVSYITQDKKYFSKLYDYDINLWMIAMLIFCIFTAISVFIFKLPNYSRGKSTHIKKYSQTNRRKKARRRWQGVRIQFRLRPIDGDSCHRRTYPEIPGYVRHKKDVDYSTSLFYFIRFLVLYLLYQIS